MVSRADNILNNATPTRVSCLHRKPHLLEKQINSLDYKRALADVLQSHDAVRAMIEKLERPGTNKEALVPVTADYGHGLI